MQRATGWPAAICAAIIITTGAALRLYALDTMEFKGDERESLLHAMRPSNAPLFTWIIAAMWAPDLMLTGLLAILWGIAWWREGRPWRALALLLTAVLCPTRRQG